MLRRPSGGVCPSWPGRTRGALFIGANSLFVVLSVNQEPYQGPRPKHRHQSEKPLSVPRGLENHEDE